ncbi:hypothetical protein PAPYR_6188 [Paratrimastix pyriformis]|uniref:RWD domain-containing protein n=1 Tax=Paratrimastix pyriformis TaxID=342808 RepID=A0ABQ8UFN5_9EUKA|nr:hypothetical protein PAPYR_6188 [Paratrimastix pyriformis]
MSAERKSGEIEACKSIFSDESEFSYDPDKDIVTARVMVDECPSILTVFLGPDYPLFPPIQLHVTFQFFSERTKQDCDSAILTYSQERAGSEMICDLIAWVRENVKRYIDVFAHSSEEVQAALPTVSFLPLDAMSSCQPASRGTHTFSLMALPSAILAKTLCFVSPEMLLRHLPLASRRLWKLCRHDELPSGSYMERYKALRAAERPCACFTHNPQCLSFLSTSLSPAHFTQYTFPPPWGAPAKTSPLPPAAAGATAAAAQPPRRGPTTTGNKHDPEPPPDPSLLRYVSPFDPSLPLVVSATRTPSARLRQYYQLDRLVGPLLSRLVQSATWLRRLKTLVLHTVADGHGSPDMYRAAESLAQEAMKLPALAQLTLIPPNTVRDLPTLENLVEMRETGTPSLFRLLDSFPSLQTLRVAGAIQLGQPKMLSYDLTHLILEGICPAMFCLDELAKLSFEGELTFPSLTHLTLSVQQARLDFVRGLLLVGSTEAGTSFHDPFPSLVALLMDLATCPNTSRMHMLALEMAMDSCCCGMRFDGLSRPPQARVPWVTLGACGPLMRRAGGPDGPPAVLCPRGQCYLDRVIYWTAGRDRPSHGSPLAGAMLGYAGWVNVWINDSPACRDLIMWW